MVPMRCKKVLTTPFGIVTDCPSLDKLTSSETAHAGTPSEVVMYTVLSRCSAGDSYDFFLRRGFFIRNWEKNLVMLGFSH